MSSNRAIARVRVLEHLEDDVAVVLERIKSMQAQLDSLTESYRLDKSNDKLQEVAICNLQGLIDTDQYRLEVLRRQAQAVQEGNGLPETPYASLNAAASVLKGDRLL